MATANFGEGAVFEISDNMIVKMAEFDKHLKDISNNASNAATNLGKFNSAIQGLRIEDKVSVLERMAKALEKLGGASGAAQTIGQAAENVNRIGTAANAATPSVEQLARGIADASKMLNQLNVSRPFSDLNIGELKTQIENIQRMLRNQGKEFVNPLTNEIGSYPVFSKQEQQDLVNKQRLYEQELKIQQAASNAKVTAIEQVTKAQNADLQTLQKYITAQQALERGRSATTLKEEAEAIKLLEQARLNLNKTDANYKDNLAAINLAIKQHTQNLTEAKNVAVGNTEVTVKQALEESKAATTLRQEAEAVKLLEQAKLNLDKTNMSYSDNLRAINAAIQQHTQNLNNAKSAVMENMTITAQQALKESQAATTLRQEAAAIKILEQARLNLNRADSDYASNLSAINQAIKQHTQHLNEAKGAIGSNTSITAQQALESSRVAATLRQEAEAVKALEQARLNLNKSDANYAQTLALINNAIKQHTQNLNEAKNAAVGSNSITAKQALQASNQAQTLRQEAEAIKLLEQARLNLNKADKDYASNLAAINQAIKQHTQSLDDAKKAAVSNKNITAQQALAESQTARTLRDEQAAIKTLEQAKLNLNRSDANYNETLTRLNTAILEHKKHLDDAKASTTSTKQANAQQALAQSAAANTLRAEVEAVKALKEARLNLDRTSPSYYKDLRDINNAIQEHTRNLQQAGVASQSLGQTQRRLMDITGQLKRQFALLFSVSQIKGYVDQLVQTRGEFELQQRSLEAILQNKPKADEIFQKTVDLAIHSPFQIKDLISYTKQLAAYRIESDDLYDTTKRLADVSAGLGIDMQRLILAYGQVKAAAYLRGTEVRQFTEAGINMYGELQRYFKDVKGEAYTTAQIVDMISKRKVTFEDIEAIFKRMTDAGGLFYNMQEIQSQTLTGKLANLKDSISVMLNSIGKDNQGILIGAIDATTALLKNWEAISKTIIIVGAGLLAAHVRTVLLNSDFYKNYLISTALNARTNVFLRTLNGIGDAISYSTKSMKGFGASFLTTIAVAGITYIATALYSYQERLQKIRETIAKINADAAELKITMGTISYDFNNAKAEDGKTVFDQQKEQLSKLQEEAAKRNIEIPSRLKAPTQSNIKQVFKETQNYINSISEISAYIQKALAEGGSGFFEASTVSLSKEFAESADNITTSTAQIKAAINLLYSSPTTSDATKKELIELRKQMQMAGDDATKLIPIINKLAKMTGPIRTKPVVPGQAATDVDQIFSINGEDVNVYKTYIKDLENSVDSYEGNLTKLQGRWADILNNIRASSPELFKSFGKGSKEAGEQIMAAIKGSMDPEQYRESARQGFVSYANEWARSIYGRPLVIQTDVKEAQQQAESLSEWFRKYFNSKNYSIKVKIRYEDLGKENIGQDLLDEGDNMHKAAERVEKLLARVRRTVKQTFSSTDLGIDASTWMTQFGPSRYVTKAQATQYLSNLAKANATAAANAGYVDEKVAKKTATKAAKQERDIWQERIDTLQKMADRYEKVRAYLGEKEAALNVRASFVNAAKYVKWDISKFLPSKEGLIKELGKIYSSPAFQKAADFTKKSNLQQKISELKVEIDQERLQKSLDEARKRIDLAFSGLDLHKRLTDIGLSENEVQALFPGISKTLDDVEKQIKATFDKLRDPKTGQLGKEEQKQYDDLLKQLNDQRIKEQQDLALELTKAYKTQLSDQLQLDLWYYGEREKIAKERAAALARINADTTLSESERRQRASAIEGLTSTQEKNLQTQYNAKTSENAWTGFKSSDTYITMFSNLEYVSTKTIESMRAKLDSLKESLKDLNPTELKAVADLYTKMDEQLSQRNPLDAFLKSYQKIKELQDNGLTEDRLNESIMANDTENAALQREINMLTTILSLRDGAIQKSTVDASILQKNNELQGQSSEQIRQTIKEKETLISKNRQENAENTKNLGYYSKARKDLNTLIDAWGSIKQAGQQAMGSINTILTAMGADADSTAMTMVNMVGNLADMVIQAIMFQLQLQLCAAQAKLLGVSMSSAMGPIGWVLLALQGVATVLSTILGSSDKKKQKQIEAIERQVKRLQRAYESLKESMDNAWNLQQLNTYKKALEENLKLTNQNLRAQIAIEKSRKKPDEGKISDWENTIADNEKKIIEARENFLQSLGGFGSDEEYKNAAQEFADAWVDAFKEGDNALDALNDKWNEYMQNLIKKQAMLGVTNKLIDPYLKQIDSALKSYGENGDIEKLGEAVKDITKKIQDVFPDLNEELKDLWDTLGGNMTRTDNLTALQQGIEGVTEQTAQALEALLNSMRFFLSMQQSDVAVIKGILQNTLAKPSLPTQTVEEEPERNNPILSELRAQSILIRGINTLLESVCTYDGRSAGRGIRVYVK